METILTFAGCDHRWTLHETRRSPFFAFPYVSIKWNYPPQNPPSKESKATLVYHYVQLQKRMVNMEYRLRREMEVKKVNMIPLDLQGHASEVIRDEQIEGCWSIGSNFSMSDLHHRQDHDNFISPSENTFPLAVHGHASSGTTSGKRHKSLQKRLVALMHRHSRKQKTSHHPSKDQAIFDPNQQSLRGTVSMSTINPQRLSREERIRKHRSMPAATTFSLYQEEKQRLIQQNVILACNRPSSSPPSPTTQKSMSSSSNRKRDSVVSLLASISLRSLFKMDSSHGSQQRNAKCAGGETLDSTDELSDTIRVSREEPMRRQESFVAYRYPKMAPLDYVEQASISYNLTARAHEIQMMENAMKRCESDNSSPCQNLAALTISF